METPLADQHRAAGADLASYFAVRLPTQFGDFSDEYRLARHHAALIDTNFRAIFSLSGPDRVRYLNAVLTSNVRDLLPGQGAIGLLLNAQGHILAELETLALEDRVLILGHAFSREKTFATLEKFIIMDDATLTDETAQSATLAIEGPAAPRVVRELTGVDLVALTPYSHAPASINTAAGPVPCRVIRHSLFGFPGAEFLLRREALAQTWNAMSAAVRAHGGGPIGYRALNALRLEAGIPWFGTDFDEHQIPHEAAVDQTHISYTKGCYTGQEIVERVRSRGHVNRRRTPVAFSRTEPPAPGAILTAASAPAGQSSTASNDPRGLSAKTEGGPAPVVEVGQVTSAAFSPLLGKPIGMGYLRREHSQPGSKLQCDGAQAEVIELPLPGCA
jgi:folate-binding protein YgfZ